MNTTRFSYSLAAQFAIPQTIKHIPSSIKQPKVRNKKVKEKQEYDILQLDNQIRNCFESENSNIGEYNKRIRSIITTLLKIKTPFGIDQSVIVDITKLNAEYQTTIQGPAGSRAAELLQSVTPITPPQILKENIINLTYREYLNLYDELKRLITKVDNIQSGILLQTYESMSRQLIEDYQKLLEIPIKSRFLGKNKAHEDFDEKKKLMLQDYLHIAELFIPIDCVFEPIKNQEKYTCECGNSDLFQSSDSFLTCEECGLEMPIMATQTSYRDCDRVNLHQKYKYEKKSHFRDNVNQYQGKQNKSIDKDLYTQADEWLEKHGLLNTEAKNKKEKYTKVKKEHVRLFLSESGDGNNKFYEDTNLIYSKLTGVACPDISHLEDKLFADFDLLVDAFLNLEDITRTNFLNSQYVLKQLLIRHGYKINPEDFPGLKTRERQREHDDIYSALCEKCNFSFRDSI